MKLGVLAAISTITGALAFATMSSPTAEAADACKRTTFKTDLVKSMCESGGQAAAKKKMQEWMKAAKIKSCNKCHSKLAPNYELKDSALKDYEAAGGDKLVKYTSTAKAGAGSGAGKGTGGGGGKGTGGGGGAGTGSGKGAGSGSATK